MAINSARVEKLRTDRRTGPRGSQAPRDPDDEGDEGGFGC